ncbi:restriction endonuclease [Rhodococcus sp. NPDC055024]
MTNSETSDWRARFHDADVLPETADSQEKATRGRKFEKILAAMFSEDNLQPRLSYRPKGEEVDGSIWFQGRVILVEAKWTQKHHPASSLYSFRGKVDGKLTGTVGLFISMSGFSPDSIDALIAGKELNLILVDGDDVRAIANRKITVTEALELKLRAAGETGTPFLPLSDPVISTRNTKQRNHLVFVEGPFDARVLEAARTVLGARHDATFIPTGGPSNMAPLIKAMLLSPDGIASITAIIDGNHPSHRHMNDLQEIIDATNTEHGNNLTAELITLHPDLDSAFGLLPPNASQNDRMRLRRLPEHELKQWVKKAITPTATDSQVLSAINAAGARIPMSQRAE